MHGNLSGPSRPAINSTVQTDRHLPDTSDQPDAQSGSDWFPQAAKVILGKDAGLHLHYLTGYPERSCYRYASGERAPPENFLRKLFHSSQGEPFHAAFMHGCGAQWWLDVQRQRRVGAAALNEF